MLPHFTSIMQGYWLLDNDQYEQAVPLLAVADFIPKIIRTLFLPSPNNNRSDVARSKLLLRFLRTSSSPSSSPLNSESYLQEVEMHITALCFISGPTRALHHIRSLTSSILDEENRVSIRARLIFRVLEHCFAPPRAAAIQNLLASSLDPEEEVTLESFVLSPPAAMTATWSYVAADVLIVRYISQGRYMDAVGLDRRLGPDVGVGHAGVRDAAGRSKMMEQRKRMIAGAREILPEVQKEVLRLEESAEISGGAHREEVNGDVNGRSAENKVTELEKVALTPLSASPAARGRVGNFTPSTQAAILSAVVRASASPSAPSTPSKGVGSPAGTPSRATPQQQAAAMIGFLAKNSLSGQKPPNTADGATQDEDMDEHEDTHDTEESAVLVSRPSQPASPWRNTPSLTSSSPFSGLPKLSRPALTGAAVSAASGSRSPFAAAASASSSSSIRSPSAAKLSGALGLVSQHGRKSRLAREPESFNEESSDAEEQDMGDDTFTQPASKKEGGDVSVGRLVPGRRGWVETQTPQEEEVGELPPPKRRARKPTASPSKKITRSRTGTNLNTEDNEGGKLSKSKSEVGLAGKRMTRSASSVNRKPLTLSNLEQLEEERGPIARRTRAATAELESLTDAGRAEGGSTIYTISEVDGDETKSPTKRATRRTTAGRGGVRRSTRLTSTEPEMEEVSSPAKRRGGRKSKMPGSLE